MQIESIGFLDIALEKEFSKKGYVIIDLLENEKIKSLINYFNAVKEEISLAENHYYSSGDHPQKDISKKIDLKIKEYILPELDKYIHSFEALMAAYIVKPGNENSNKYFDFHQDLTFVDENKYTSANLWIALQDTNEENGTLKVVEHTHTFKNTIRSAPEFPCYYQGHEKKILSCQKSINLKAGQAIIFNHRIVHGSPPNKSKDDRIAVISMLKPKSAHWIHYRYDKETNLVKKYRADYEFFLEMWSSGKLDPENLINEFSYVFPKISLSELIAFLIKQNISSFTGFLKK